MKTKNNIKTLSQILDEKYGEKGTPDRNEFDKGFEYFKLSAMIHQARLDKGLTQEQLAQNAGQTKLTFLK